MHDGDGLDLGYDQRFKNETFYCRVSNYKLVIRPSLISWTGRENLIFKRILGLNDVIQLQGEMESYIRYAEQLSILNVGFISIQLISLDNQIANRSLNLHF